MLLQLFMQINFNSQCDFSIIGPVPVQSLTLHISKTDIPLFRPKSPEIKQTAKLGSNLFQATLWLTSMEKSIHSQFMVGSFISFMSGEAANMANINNQFLSEIIMIINKLTTLPIFL